MIEQLNQFNLANYPPEVCHLDPPEVLARDNCTMIGVYDGPILCGIGAVKLFDDYGEIKRMFVAPKYRGQRLSTLILDELLQLIRAKNIPIARLETGTRHHAALVLYRKHGFIEREPYADYPKTDLNIYMEKRLRG